MASILYGVCSCLSVGRVHGAHELDECPMKDFIRSSDPLGRMLDPISMLKLKVMHALNRETECTAIERFECAFFGWSAITTI
jgi:hypothetical protein